VKDKGANAGEQDGGGSEIYSFKKGRKHNRGIFAEEMTWLYNAEKGRGGSILSVRSA